MLASLLDLQINVRSEVELPIELHAEIPGLVTVLDLLAVDPELAGEVDVGQLALDEENCHGLGGSELQASLRHPSLDLVQSPLHRLSQILQVLPAGAAATSSAKAGT